VNNQGRAGLEFRLAIHCQSAFADGADRHSGRVYLPQYIFDDQSVEIVCKHCRTTSPKTIAWMQANESYHCAGCNAEIIIDREKLLAPPPPGFDDDGLGLKAKN
jgi:hypothetical protein